MATTKRFHRHYDVPGLPLYWIIIAYIIIGWFWPVIGLLALICMIGPVLTSIWRGRWWCGNVCPRGNMCARVCPMQLTPYECRGEEIGYLHPDCLKCGKCEKACPLKITELRH
ncbi:MAG: 4Fe-4S binding protein [Prevotella sp.]|nr:4Fe-4S binding protein [Prevotella sp.]